ncbi:MAG: hypothetical protein RL766_589 [Bacteroidota bacterium]|jgi:hypothetical protein
MNLDYQQLIPENFSKNTRVWIYQSSRLFTLSEALQLEEELKQFGENWLSHGASVNASCFLFFGYFIILMADEAEITVSGCSTDSSVRFVKNIEQSYNVSLFDRTNLAFIVKDKIELLPLSQVNYAIQNGYISDSTLFFDNAIQDISAFKNKWIVPVADSWLGKRLNNKIKE